MVHNARNQWTYLDSILPCLLARSLLFTFQLPVSECLLVGRSKLHALEFTFKKKLRLCNSKATFKSIQMPFYWLFSSGEKMQDWKMNAKDETLHIHWLSAWIDKFIKRRKQDCWKVSVWVRDWEFCLWDATRVLFREGSKKAHSVALFIFTVGYKCKDSSPT